MFIIPRIYLKWFAVIAVIVVLQGLVVGCGAAMEQAAAPMTQSMANSGGEAARDSVSEPEPGAVYADGNSIVFEQSLVQPQDLRVIIYTGSISLVVKDTQESIAAISALAEGQGGYVANANVYQSSDVLRGSITIRVPAEQYQAVLAQLRGLALRVERENSSSQDVTEEFTDLQARKTNLEFTETALQTLLEERQRIGSTADILEVYRELTTIRGQIEQIEGRLRYLSNQAALSTLDIELIPDVLYQPITVGGWEPQGVAREALIALIATLQGLANVFIWLIVFVVPLLFFASLPVLLLFLVVRWWWKRSRPKQQKPSAPEGTP